MNRKIKAILRKPLYWLESLFFYLLLKLPETVVRVIHETAGWLFCRFGYYWKQEALRNLKLVYGNERSDADLKAIANASMRNMLKMAGELVIIAGKPSSFFDTTSIEGEQYLQTALNQGKGVIVQGCHVGNFIYGIVVLSNKGYPVSYVHKEPKDEALKDFLGHVKKILKLNPIPLHPRRIAIKKTLMTLKAKKILWLAIDQDTRKGSVGVELFGVKAATAQGSAVLAQKTGAAVLPMYVKRIDWMKHKIVVKPPVELIFSGDKEKDKYSNLKRMNEALEEIILDNPEEWMWVHRRWKRADKYTEE